MFTVVYSLSRKHPAFAQIETRSAGYICSYQVGDRTGTEAGTSRPGVVGKNQSNSLERDTTMKLLNIFKSFKNDDSGAVTVDWVVLTAAIVGLGLVVMTSVGGGVKDLASDLEIGLKASATGF